VRSPHVGTGRRQSSGRDIVAKPSLHIRNGATYYYDLNHSNLDDNDNDNDCAHDYNYDGATYYYDLNHSNLDDNDNDNDNDNDGESTDYYDDS
jgi:hypothetical protein